MNNEAEWDEIRALVQRASELRKEIVQNHINMADLENAQLRIENATLRAILKPFSDCYIKMQEGIANGTLDKTGYVSHTMTPPPIWYLSYGDCRRAYDVLKEYDNE